MFSIPATSHLLIWLMFFGSGMLFPVFGQVSEHPRGLITREEVPALQDRLKVAPYDSFFTQLQNRVIQASSIPVSSRNSYDEAYLGSQAATLYLLTETPEWANLAWEQAQKILADTIFTDPVSRGLTRAMLLQQAAIIYDFCYSGWSQDQREALNTELFPVILSVSANMGPHANYNMASNWMGVRYGAVIFAASVWDDPMAHSGKKSSALPFIWDSTKRLKDHLEANLYENGWNGESMGYHAYGWSFVAPALIALQNNSSSPAFQLVNFTPKSRNTLWGISTSQVDIPTQMSRGMKADLSDDNLSACPPGLFATGFRLAPADQLPFLKWMFDYRFSPAHIDDARNGLIFSLLYYPDKPVANNPQAAGWLNYHDPQQGIAIFRNQFQDSSDIVFTLSATRTRVRGHQGPDTHSWRLLGLGVPWVIGGGRTGATYLQSNLYPDSADTPIKSRQETGDLLAFGFQPKGGFTHSTGSCLGVKNHSRKTYISYDPQIGCKAAILMEESSANGKRWRIQTPGFNDFQLKENGYLLTAPNGATMQVRVLNPSDSVRVNRGLHRYGGKTVRHNPGIRFGGKTYSNSRWIDIECEANLTLLITLQEAGKEHPDIRPLQSNGWEVGNKALYIR